MLLLGASGLCWGIFLPGLLFSDFHHTTVGAERIKSIAQGTHEMESRLHSEPFLRLRTFWGAIPPAQQAPSRATRLLGRHSSDVQVPLPMDTVFFTGATRCLKSGTQEESVHKATPECSPTKGEFESETHLQRRHLLKCFLGGVCVSNTNVFPASWTGHFCSKVPLLCYVVLGAVQRSGCSGGVPSASQNLSV